MNSREIKPSELLVIERLYEFSGSDCPTKLEKMLVRQIGGERAFSILNSINNGSGKKIASGTFMNDDELPVIVDLFTTNTNDFLSLDFWKVDYSSIIRMPSNKADITPDLGGKPLN